jgi:hypothetical protein
MWGIEAKDVAIFVGGIVVTVIIGFIFYRLTVQKKRLNYSVERKLLVHRGRDWPAELKLFYGQTETTSLVHFRIFVWNGGNLPIIANDLATTSPPEFGLSEEVKNLHLVVSRQSRTANAVDMVGLQPKFEFLNVGDGFVVDLFAQAPEFSGKVWLKGDVVGADAPKEREIRFAKSFFFRLFGLILLGAILVFSVVISSMYFVDFPGKTAGWAAVYSVFGLVLAMSAAVGLFNLLRAFFTRRIPRELLDEHIFSLQRLRRLLKFGQGKMVNEG